MNRQEILDRLDHSREELLIILERLPDQALITPGVMDIWSIGDILGHLVVWESELVTALMRLKQRKKPTRLLAAYEDVDGYNEQRYQENKNRDLDRIFDDLMGVRLRLEEWLLQFSDQELNHPPRYKGAGKRALWELIEENSFGHEAQHLSDIEEFAAKWLSGSDMEAA